MPFVVQVAKHPDSGLRGTRLRIFLREIGILGSAAPFTRKNRRSGWCFENAGRVTGFPFCGLDESPLHEDLFLEAVELYRNARRAGLTIRSSADCLIAVTALRSSVTILHQDRDFDALAQVAPLTVRRIPSV